MLSGSTMASPLGIYMIILRAFNFHRVEYLKNSFHHIAVTETLDFVHSLHLGSSNYENNNLCSLVIATR